MGEGPKSRTGLTRCLPLGVLPQRGEPLSRRHGHHYGPPARPSGDVATRMAEALRLGSAIVPRPGERRAAVIARLAPSVRRRSGRPKVTVESAAATFFCGVA